MILTPISDPMVDGGGGISITNIIIIINIMTLMTKTITTAVLAIFGVMSSTMVRAWQSPPLFVTSRPPPRSHHPSLPLHNLVVLSLRLVRNEEFPVGEPGRSFNDDNDNNDIIVVSHHHYQFWNSLLFAGLLSVNTATIAFAAAEDVTVPSQVPATTGSIESCRRSTSSSNGNNNCVSTASVKQVDLFMLPWSWPESISSDEVISRLKGVVAADQTLSLIDASTTTTTTNNNNNNNNQNYFVRIRAARNVCTDEIEFLVNPNDRVMTFRSQQVEGPDQVSDFGANRRRLDEIRQRLKVVTVLGSSDNDDDHRGESREGLTGQLKAFWGFQSGGGFESILLDEDE